MIKAGKRELENLGQGGGPPQSILKNAEAAQTIGEKLQIMRNNIDEALRPAAMPLFDQLGHSVEGLTKWVQANEPQIIDFFKDVTIADAACYRRHLTTGLGVATWHVE